MALAASGVIVLADVIVPQMGISSAVTTTLKSIDFANALMNGMLSILLFAGAVHVDLDELAQRKWAIGLMATLGVLTTVRERLGDPAAAAEALSQLSRLAPTELVLAVRPKLASHTMFSNKHKTGKTGAFQTRFAALIVTLRTPASASRPFSFPSSGLGTYVLEAPASLGAKQSFG